MQSPTLPPDLTNEEAMRLLNVSRTTLDRLVKTGQLQAYKLSPRRQAGRRIRRDSVEAFRAGGGHHA